MSGRHIFLCSVIVAVFVTVTDSATYSCYSNQTMCLSDLRQLLVNTNKFWFGSSYSTSCPGGSSSSPACNNPDTNKTSILSRLLDLDDNLDQDILNETTDAISLANITFNAPAGNYTGCGQEYQIPALNDYLVDPLDITLISSWSLRQTPKVTWNPKTQNTSHILVIWDPGNFFLHGLYINCVNGSLDSGEAVRPYFGPLNTHLRANTYIFAVYEQTETIDIDASLAFINGKAYIQPASFLANFNTSMNSSRPVHAGVMTIVADPYSVQRIYDRFFMVNNCPYLISQLDIFRAMVGASNLTVPWSDNTTSLSLYRSTPYLTSLTTSIDVRYWTDDFSVQSCCTEYSLTRGSFIVNPFSNATVRPGNIRLTPKVEFTAIDLRSMTGIAGGTYTLFLLDVADALGPAPENATYVTHWLVTNIQNADINTGDQVAQYFGPNPFTPNQHRPYIFLLLRQPMAKLNNTIFSNFCPNGTMRCRIQLKPVLVAWNLTEIVGMTWFLAEQDPFARYRIYSVIKAMTQDTACKGVPGYADPCPKPCSGDNNRGVLSRLNVAVLGLVLGVVSYFVGVL